MPPVPPALRPTEPGDIPGFVKLVARARAKQHGSLIYKQYLKLIGASMRCSRSRKPGC